MFDALLTDRRRMDFKASSEKPMGPVHDSSLLGLPMEVFQMITRHMDEATFFTSLLTCKHFLKAARSSRTNLLRHMHRLTTPKIGLDGLSTPDLLLEYRIRAAATACAAGVLADVWRYVPTPGVKIAISAFSPPSKSSNHSAQLAVVHECGTITIYYLMKRHIRRKTEIHIRPQDGNTSPMEILRMTFSARSRDLALLYRQQDLETPRVNNGHPAVSDTVLRLVTFHRLRDGRMGHFYDSHQQETRNLAHNSEVRPVGLALAANGTACVAFSHPGRYTGNTVYLYERNEKLMKACFYDCAPHIKGVAKPSCLPSQEIRRYSIFNVEFVENDRKLNLHKAGNPVHSWYTAPCDPRFEGENELAANVAYIDLGDEETDKPDEIMVGMPFHGHHVYHGPETVLRTVTECTLSYLALGTTKTDQSSSQPVHGFIMQAIKAVPGHLCDHNICLGEGRKISSLSWQAIALLGGWRQGTSSLGTVLPISPDGGRIAAATWTRVLVWSLNAPLLHGDSYPVREYFPSRDFNRRKNLGRLRPVQLPCDAVVHNMLWTNEHHLFAVTDRGLIKWDIGHMSKGVRAELTFP